MSKEFSFFTDTATMAIFDLAAIKHRISDTSDWWSIEEDEIDEVNKGNIAFLDLGSDGSYVVKIQEEVDDEDGSLNLSFPTGQVFILGLEKIQPAGNLNLMVLMLFKVKC